MVIRRGQTTSQQQTVIRSVQFILEPHYAALGLSNCSLKGIIRYDSTP